MIVKANRISGLDDPPKARRTPAQQEAARRNGAKSRGPKTADGKARSRQNSLKHGFRAQHLKLPCDTRFHDRLYKKFCRELMDEYQPEGLVARLAVEALAHDCVEMLRCRQYLEEVQRPASISNSDRRKWKKARRSKVVRGWISKAVAQIRDREDLQFTTKQARAIARWLVKLVNDVEEHAEVLEEQGLLDGYDADEDLLEDGEWEPTIIARRNWRLVKPMRRRLGDEDHLAAVLSGNRVPARGELNRIAGLLKTFTAEANVAEYFAGDAEKPIRRETDKSIRRVAFGPEQVVTLERYLRRIEKAIDRKVSQLEGR